MIDIKDAKKDMHVFYQRAPMARPDYGLIVRTNEEHCSNQTQLMVFVLFVGDSTPKACRPADLYWPPDYCAADCVNPAGQKLSRPEEMPLDNRSGPD